MDGRAKSESIKNSALTGTLADGAERGGFLANGGLEDAKNLTPARRH